MTTLPLASITRISPFNPNQDMESDVSSLAATIRAIGMEYPLSVRERPDVRGEFEVLDGGRRWRALKLLAAQDSGFEEHFPEVKIFNGDDAGALQLALTLSVTPRAKHPVDDFERFSLLVEQHGRTIADIARDFGETERLVRQRLALAALAPRVREMWRKGEITREAAEAYTIAPLAAQEALLDDWEKRAPGKIKDAFFIRAALRGDTMVAVEPVAKFICADLSRLAVYRDRGGRVLEDLFSEQPGLQDPPIAVALANDLLRDEAQWVADAEGWGHAFAGEDEGGFEECLLSTDDEERLNTIARELAGECSKAKRKKLIAEREAIMAAVDDRAAYGVRADLDAAGEIYFTRGVALPDEAAQRPGGDDQESPPGESEDQSFATCERPEQGDVPKPLGDPGKQLRAVIDAGATLALRDAVRQRPDIALMLAVAALGCQWGAFGLGLRPVQSQEPEDDDLLKRIRPLYFADALAACAEASTNDLTVAFARIVAVGMEAQGIGFDAIGKLFQAIAARGGDVTGAILRAHDHRAFFEAAEKERTLRIIGALIGPAEAARASRMKKDKLAAHAATLAKEKGYLPPPFGNWVSFPTRSGALDEAIYSDRDTPLAQAMREAIDKDEAGESTGKGRRRGPRKTPIEKAIAKTKGAAA
ncbi:ParB/RepB/Spo0J family partition protein [Methylocystis sp. MJC1]|jgi:ParB family chromosome partitioning protein|uniref:ParB/RepB/Spo0J family partition protein n=1 Tax=Methylocystis sp. MJC1 TaxID=2654282 RepID=UPI0013EE241E|nr:ParB/RepB/Spo0J family partition protein [Methylocystis sp. MJC1]KAF2990821.1 Chromosome-partitioning protein ParB [Methylocystis sp. MJC1]MBU6527716.1 ParB/RepB/Spo0J family partition protein [Methylocystis sp. MJC1]UZX10652.1 ParB/RepB/Spo0J family partition protein [Methylocystis sp. MJC1]